MEWLTTLSLALGSAWTSGINLYATVTVLGVFQKFGWAKLPGGLEVLDNWWIIGIAGGLYAVEFVADKVPYVDSVWDVIHTFIRIPAGALIAYSATTQTDPSFNVIATLLGGSLALTSHGTKSALRAAANLSPEPFSNWILSFVEDAIAWTGAILAIVAPILLLILIGIFLLIFAWFAPKIFRAMRRMWRATRSLFAGEGFREVAQKAG